MSPLQVFTVVSASLLLLAVKNGAYGETKITTKYSVNLGADGQCLEHINAARVAAGLSLLKQAPTGATEQRLPVKSDCDADDTDTYKKWVWKPVCEALIPNVNSEHPIESAKGDVKFESGTYAFHPFHSEGVSCSAAVKQWKSAFTNFSGVPPPNKEGETAYTNQSNVSLVAMYNPSPNATADCRLVTCTQSVTQDSEQPKTTAASALICLTTPDALPKDGTTAPFTEEQWGKIVSSIRNSASTAVPSMVGLAAAILGFGIMVL
ncbi:SAG family member [Eimeria acervulina]|uniref:SAG family member n=1 Tax=Eimeria acervulina TaxID=5801 RepID=U6GM39_EIMAC|nr:SAG family member [Eimeria acervulina]CDI79669.1 SAG family member [Eimeria acervulina]